MATGALLFAPPVAAVQLRAAGAALRLCPLAVPWGLAAGAVYGAGTALSIKAIDSLNYGVAYTLVQCSVLVAGAWGIVLYRELEGRPVAVFAVSSAVLIAGAIAVGYYGTAGA
jgi:hypothetical protein